MTATTLETVADIVPSFRLDNRTAVLTGGAGGLSLTLSKALVAQGANVALVDLNIEACQAAAADLVEWASAQGIAGPKVSAWACNVGDALNVQECVAAINEFYGEPADLLIHTAGYCQNFSALEYPDEKAAALVNVNLMGSYYISKYVAKALADAGKPGSLILIGSMSGVIVNDPQPQVAYNMSKAGVIHLTKSLACEWAQYGIRVNCLSPGYIATPLTKHVIGHNVELKDNWESKIPQHRMADPREFVGSILYFASMTASSYTTGENLVVDGGYQCW
ncbi:CYFA0S01e10902g1_1 [Cyberlindnera fabianii]|uniref:D-arabinitol 2-dehydrogenase [ribulose-forming] n=1 Tax=Cyberlindnera fabianii TaxID=36022 RepID=A0A061AIX4_CYBFA|nr:D-arabinitol 2-dehydrogenase [ribulose-forming] [Cyberlindnera fabianii]CDR37464.1 CYFA0S01e10902g1_1 [Cyberlindnera fabianii]